MMKHENALIQLIADYLMKQAETDEQLKKAIDNMETNEKTLNSMWAYIVRQAQDQLGGKSGAIQDSTVYGWAIHYMTEPNSVLGIAKKEEKEEEQTREMVDLTPKKKEKTATMPKGYVNAQQLSLFDDEV